MVMIKDRSSKQGLRFFGLAFGKNRLILNTDFFIFKRRNDDVFGSRVIDAPVGAPV